jgi:hypothetical protein
MLPSSSFIVVSVAAGGPRPHGHVYLSRNALLGIENFPFKIRLMPSRCNERSRHDSYLPATRSADLGRGMDIACVQLFERISVVVISITTRLPANQRAILKVKDVYRSINRSQLSLATKK